MPLPTSFDFSDNAGTVLLIEPDAVNDRPVALQQGGESVITPISGARYTAKDDSGPAAVWTFDYFAVDRAQLQALRDFFDAQRGMAGAYNDSDGTSRGFWFPTWQWELEIADYDPGSPFGHDYLWMLPRGYGASIFPLGPQYRRLVLVYGASYQGRQVLAVAADAGLERIDCAVRSLAPFTAPARPWSRRAGVRPLWLRYGRFDTDDFTYRHVDGGDAFQVSLSIRELPDEAPAGS